MKISDRLADFVVIGGFFWITQLTMIAVIGAAPSGWKTLPKFLSDLMAAIPASAAAPVFALAGTFALIVVFTTGVFIDLLASSYFRPSRSKL
jgi:hypothetical protein